VLELGCGTGRILRPLAALGHPVTGVDDSTAMLACSPDLATICSPIESLRLDRAFDVVLLASTLINADPGTRRGFLAAVRRHLRDDGTAVFQQSPPGWFESIDQAERTRDDPGGIRRITRSARWEPPRLVHRPPGLTSPAARSLHPRRVRRRGSPAASMLTARWVRRGSCGCLRILPTGPTSRTRTAD